MLAREHPAVGWLGLCNRNEALMGRLAAESAADFTTVDFRELVARPDVTAVIVATDENERGHALFIEKPPVPMREETSFWETTIPCAARTGCEGVCASGCATTLATSTAKPSQGHRVRLMTQAW